MSFRSVRRSLSPADAARSFTLALGAASAPPNWRERMRRGWRRRHAEAEAAVAAFERLRGELAEALRGSLSGRELVDAGWPDDVDVASDLDADDLVPILDGNAFRATR